MRAIHVDVGSNGHVERLAEGAGGPAGPSLGTDWRDVLGDVLDAVHLKADIGPSRKLSGPWSLALEHGASGFWVMLEGRARIETNEGEDEYLEAGDLMVVTRSAPHALESIGGPRDACTIVEGRFDFENRGFAPLKTALPQALIVRGQAGLPQAWLTDVLRLVQRELGDRKLGSRAIVNRLGHIIYLNGVREYAAGLPKVQGGWLGAILSPDLGPSIGAMHLKPEASWTVETLAEEAGLSRSVFAERFATLVGMTPMRYLLECRMQRASALLKDRSLGIKEVALRVGYGSEAAFGNAFKRWAGTSPGSFREVKEGKVGAAPPPPTEAV